MATALLNEKGRIVIDAPFQQSTKMFCRSLPRSRWDVVRRQWTCQATAATAWRILNGGIPDVQAGPAVEALASRFRMFTTLVTDQPPTRKLDSWKHQCEGYSFANGRAAGLLSMGMGSGKTKTVIDVVQNNLAPRSTFVLILCPASVLGVWRREFRLFCAVPHDVLVLDKKQTVAKKVEAAERFCNRPHGGIVAVVMNYEASIRPEMLKWITDRTWHTVISDESHRLKTVTSKTSKAAAGLTSEFKWALTGTAFHNSPLDIYGQFQFLDPGLLDPSWSRFRNTYAVSGPFGANHIVSYKNLEELAQRIAPMTFEVKTADLDLNLPPVQHVRQELNLPPKTMALYYKLEQELIADLHGGEVITAPNALVKLLRLQQLTSGHVKPDDSDSIMEVDSPKEGALLDLLDGMGGSPCVVFCKFKHDLDIVRRSAEKMGLEYGEVSGRHKCLTSDAKMPEGIDVLGVQIASGGVGIDLTAAHYGVYFSVGHSLGDYEQSVARLDRPGQLHPVTFYHLVCTGTVDVAVYAALEDKADVVATVSNYLKDLKG